MKVTRLLNMGLSELACRSRQQASKWLERAGAVGRNGRPDAIFKRLAPGCFLDGLRSRLSTGDFDGAATMVQARFREAPSRGLFTGAVAAEATTLLAERLPWACDEMIATAEEVCRKHFDLLGFRRLFFGDPVCWNLDPLLRRQAPVVHWSKIDFHDPCVVGDMKIVWELNRHQWLVQLGLAYRLTGNERYAETFVAFVRQWLEANPPGRGINWASSLELALRLIAWCWGLCLFRDSPALSGEFIVRVLSGIEAHGASIERYLSYYFSPNTHLTGEALGLFYAGSVFPELRAAGRWRDLGARILLEQIERQVHSDGVYFEQATGYQRYTVEIYLHFLILAGANGVVLPTLIGERVQQMLDFLLFVRCPDGSIPQIGDDDGGWLLPLAKRAPYDLRGVFSTAAAFFGRADYAWAAGGLAPETVWLLGGRGLSAFDTLSAAPPTSAPSRLFGKGGYVIMRGAWDEGTHHLIFDVGPLGCPISAAHGHADLLSIQCSVFGEPCLVDPGTYRYTSEPDWREFFRGTAAHSTVMLDGLGQTVAAGPFQWKVRPRARLHRWLSTDKYDYADASHDAYRRLSDPVVHRRRVLFMKPRYWVVVDDLDGKANHRVELRFQFGSLDATVDQDLWARALGRGGRALLVRPFAMVPLSAMVRTGRVAPMEGWVSPIYGQRHSAPLLVYSTTARLPLRIMTLLLPSRTPVVPSPVVHLLPGGPGGPGGIELPDFGERIWFGEHELVVERR